MSQSQSDTRKRVVGKEDMRAMRRTCTVIREGNEIEVPYCYGYAARKQFGARHPRWNEGLEVRLRKEWTAVQAPASRDWEVVLPLVCRGYDVVHSPCVDAAQLDLGLQSLRSCLRY